MHYKKRPRVNDEPRLLPLDYDIGEDCVMIGRGRRCMNNEGNRRFRAMVKAELRVYSAGRKGKKSTIIKRILRHIRSSCGDGIGFIKQDALSGRYYTATEAAAKVTIAQAFRDALHEEGYKSSKQHKQFKRDLARGKVNPNDPDAMCSTCMDELQAIKDKELAAPPVVDASAGKDETSLFFWEGNVGLPTLPAIDEHMMAHALTHEHACDHDHDHEETMPNLALSHGYTPTTEPMKEADPFEPIPFSEAMKVVEDVNGYKKTTPSDHETDSTESTGCDEEITDDEEDAMVVWSTEFVHCPRCSIVEGKHDFGELPICDIRKALIG